MQLKAVGGVASQAELDALKKRVRDLERAPGMTASGRAKRAGIERRQEEEHTCEGHDEEAGRAHAEGGGFGLASDA